MLNLKAILLGVAAGAAALIMAFVKGSQSAANKIRAKSAEKTLEAERKASKVMADGLKKENETAKDDTPSKPSRFT